MRMEGRSALSLPADEIYSAVGGPRQFMDLRGDPLPSEDDIDLQAIGYAQLAALTNGTVDAVVVYANNEPAVLAEQGIAYNGVWAADYVSLVSAVIVSSDAYIADRATSSESPREITVNGLPATEFQYSGTTDFTTFWLDGNHSFEARGVFPDRAAYEAILAALKTTDIDTWLNAMPASVVKPDSREAVIAAMLEGIPLPHGFDVTALETSSGVSDRYQLGAHVAGAVTCEWIEQWIDAREAGDTAAENEAVTAMRSSHDWAILHEMAQSGGYSQVLWEYVDSIAADGTVPGEQPTNVMESSEHALGCDQ